MRRHVKIDFQLTSIDNKTELLQSTQNEKKMQKYIVLANVCLIEIEKKCNSMTASWFMRIMWIKNKFINDFIDLLAIILWTWAHINICICSIKKIYIDKHKNTRKIPSWAWLSNAKHNRKIFHMNIDRLYNN